MIATAWFQVCPVQYAFQIDDPHLEAWKHNVFKKNYCNKDVITMFKSVLLTIVLLVLAVPGEGTQPQYDISFVGEDVGPIKDVSLCVNDHSLYLAYTPPDTADTVCVKLSPELEELQSIKLDDFASPCIKSFENRVYLAGITGEQIVIHVLSDDLEFLEDFRIEIEEPVDVYILPHKEGILLSYAHRFLEDALLRQDVFVKQLDFSFNEISETRLTNWDYWEDPCLATYKDSIFVSYANAPLVSFLDRHIVITQLTWSLENVGTIRYPQSAVTEDDVPARNCVQPEMTVTDDGVLLLFRVTDRNYSYSKFTWEGMVTVVPGNIHSVLIRDELEPGTEMAITSDRREQYQPAAVSAFGKIYCAYTVTIKETKKLQIISADTPETLKVEPPPWWEEHFSWVIGLGIGLVIVTSVVILGLSRLRLKKSRKKKERRKKKKKEEKEKEKKSHK